MDLKRWLRSKWAIGVGTAVLIYTLTGFFLIPALIKSQMLKRLPALTHRRVTVQQVRLNPYALSFTLRGFALTETNGDPFVSLGELYVNFELSSIVHRGLVFSEISLKEPSANIIHLADGTFNFSNLIPTNAPAAASPKSTTNEPLPLVMVGTLSITNAGARFIDRHRATPFEQHVGPINIRLRHFTTRPKTGSPYSIVATTDTGGMFAWAGDVGINPPHSAGRFTLTGLQLNRYAPYVEDTAHIDLAGGQVDLQTDYLFDMASGAMTLAVSNAVLDVTGLQLGIAQPKPARASIGKLQLTVSGLAFDAAAKNVSIAEIRLGQLASGVTLLPGPTAPGPTQAVVATETSAARVASTNSFQVTVGAIVIDDASFRFTDESVEPKVTSAVEQFNGSIKGLTSELNTAAAVDFTGKVNGSSSFTIAGQINPLAKDLFVDLAVLFHDIRLAPISPYMAKYAGFPLEKGSLSLDLNYHVTQQELKAKNNIRIDQLTLGPASGSPDATRLPVKLAIALLQDRHGVISLDVPVTGRLDDPKFKLGPIILQVFMNILTKAATKPFALLGSMFGGGESLDFIAFEPGRADFAAGEVNKLDTLANALADRPALHLGITGSVDPVKDRDALAHIKLETQLKQARLQELAAAGQKVASVENVQLAPPDRDRLLKLAYAEAAGLVSARASGSRQETVLAHLEAHQNFGPLHPAANPGGVSGAGQPSGNALTLADMEKFLIEKTTITPADFAALMQDRATKVQQYLLQTGQVTADRLTIVAPKPVDASFQGQSRVNLTLQ
ncbi:MAG TPA: DUF748 domain-containing protein [Verrucomicrobiae bacterium]|nr:DUF748 domain-containing protein [Verrucomicrobiae bacterium]